MSDEMKWQPIDTAPKDSDIEILLYNGYIRIGLWLGDYFVEHQEFMQINNPTHWHPLPGEPTHWMPLPEPPKEDKEKALVNNPERYGPNDHQYHF